jgi:predicted  nucleic acid-binding Zn-ribbon protein
MVRDCIGGDCLSERENKPLKKPMKKSKVVILVSNLALAAVVSAFVGCASGNYEKGAGTATGLTESAEKIAVGNTNIDATLKALNDLVATTQGDLVPKFKAYNEAVDNLESAAKDVRDKVAKMREKGNAYFLAWDEQLAQIQNEDIKKRSSERKAQVQKEFMDIKQSYAQAQIDFKPFMSNLKDIQTALSTDLTMGGIGAVKGTVEKANQNAVPLKKSLDELSKQFKELGVAMSSSAPTPPPK